MLLSLGPFVLDRKIGRGGMADVWRAVHRTTGVPVAVKATRESQLRSVHARFHQEVQAVAGLQHPHVITVFDCGVVPRQVAEASIGEIEAGSSYLVMEYASGPTLAHWRTGAEWKALQLVLLRLLDALAHAHARGLVHCDIKPANILLCSEADLRPGWKLADFGIARRTGSLLGPHGSRGGTPSYMAPEQIASEAQDVGPWTDLYALGCVAWWLVTGRTPFAGARGSSLLTAQVSEPPPALAPAVPVPDGLEDWLRRLLAKDPAGRFRRAADAAQALWSLGLATTHSHALTPEPAVDRTTSTETPVVEARAFVAGRSAQESARTDRPFPSSWRRYDGALPAPFLGTGLGLFGLRTMPLVGRMAERETIWQALASTHDHGAPSAIVLVGERGVGTSRIAEWMCERGHELGACSVLRASHSQLPTSLDGLGPMLARSLRCIGMSGPALHRRIRNELARFGPVDQVSVEELAELVAGPPPGGRSVFAGAGDRHMALARYLSLAGRSRALVVWIDQGHWGEQALRLAATVLNGAPVCPVLFLISMAPSKGSDALDALVSAGASVLPVGPLGEDHHSELVREMLGLEGALAAEVERRTAGNPLFAVQWVAHWVASGQLEPGETGIRLVEGTAPQPPAGPLALWEKRLLGLEAQLGAVAMEAVELAAVLGSTVAMSEWADCGLETFAAEETVNALALLGLVQSRPREDRWSFVHPMVCEVLQRRASGAGRLQSLHLACARMLQRRGAEGANASRLGEHLFHAGALQECLEPLVEGFAWHRERTEYLRAMGALSLRERAVDRLGVPHTGFDRVRNDHMRASLGISQRRRVDEAERLLRRIIRVAEEEGWHDRAVDWTMELAILELRRGRHREGEALLIEALAAADDTPPDITTRLHYRLGRGRARMGDPDGARVHLDACLRIAEAANLPIRAADAHYGIANLELARGNVEATMAHLQKAVGPYSAGSRRTRVRLANALGDTARLAGDLDAAERHFSSLVVEPASGGLVFSINLGMVALERGLVGHSFRTLAAPRPAPSAEQATAHLSTAAALFQDGILVARTMDAPWLELVALSGLACCRAQTGHWHDCDTLLRDLIERLEGLVELDIANCAEVLGRSALAAGQTETGHRALRLALWLWHATERPQATQEVATLLATAGVRG